MAPDLARLRGLSILVVEDTFMLAEELNDILQGMGCEIVGPAARSSEASELAEKHVIDGALLDVNLSRGETTFPLAVHLANCDVPFIFITGYDIDSSFPVQFRGSPRISKPLDVSELVGAMLLHFAPAARSP